MRGAILEKQKRYYTHMDIIFKAINNVHLNYNWLINEYDCNHYPDRFIPPNKKYIWITGKDLNQVVHESKIQFIWGVFSTFNKNILLGKGDFEQ